MKKNKTEPTQQNVIEFIDNVENEKRRTDAQLMLQFFKSVTGFEPKMWGPSIIGFGKYHYKYPTGRHGEAPLAGFSPRKDALVFYMSTDFKDRERLLSKLGKCRTSKACVYAKRIEDIDLDVLQQVIQNSMDQVKELYPGQQI